MAAACGVSVANIYYNQPLLDLMARTFRRDTSYIPAFTQIGVGFGMFLFVPLGDIFERRRLIAGVCVATALAAILTALAPTLELLAVASLLLGLTSITPHLILPFAAQISAPEERGKVIGTVLSGLLIGVLLARTASGFLGAAFGWRSVYWAAAALMLALALALRASLPESPPAETMSYSQLLRSIWRLVREQPLLREASLIGAMLFGAFSVFWATLIFVLVTPPYHYGGRMAGLFGLIGVAGALAASVAGRITDRRGPRFTIGCGIAVTLLAYVVFFFTGQHLWGLIAGVTLLDLGVQAGHVANQTRIYSLIPEARSRLNTVYMVSYFAGGALGSALGAAGWSIARWSGVCAAGMLLTCVALAVHLYGSKLKTDG
ncbi:MAG: major facilitator superfamily transporter [Bryobacterales bacterium]|nr:major facilitator superfamily transporter [Bryobacterales bacterium]